MAHQHKIEVASFIGKSALVMTEAITNANAALDAWYTEQNILFFPDGPSVFQFSTAAYERADEYVFIITAFRTPYTGPAT